LIGSVTVRPSPLVAETVSVCEPAIDVSSDEPLLIELPRSSVAEQSAIPGPFVASEQA
jgi:hypothetical protein